jgi:type II secretory pathway pseudopilin PulG
MKRGAMFGLDARIALAIFGALSVISGAALYSAIQDSKATAILTEMEEQLKAFESYYIDSGKMVPLYTSGVYLNAHNFDYLLKNVDGDSNWKGPYSSLEYDDSTRLFKYNTYDTTGIIAVFEFDDWGFGSAGADITCASSEKCATYICMHDLPRSIVDALDLKIDGTLDDKKGRLRWYNDEDNPHICYRTIGFIKS